jgi:asparagine synthase (glutamine-hydrolysing)
MLRLLAPDESKVGGGFTKRILREAMRGVLPEKVRTRKSKLGFVFPIESWLNGELADWAWDRINTKAFLESEIWNGPAIRNFIGLRQTAKNWNRRDALCVRMYLQADLWRETFFGSSSGMRQGATVSHD